MRKLICLVAMALIGCAKSGTGENGCSWVHPFPNYIEKGVQIGSEIEIEILKHNEAWEAMCDK